MPMEQLYIAGWEVKQLCITEGAREVHIRVRVETGVST